MLLQIFHKWVKVCGIADVPAETIRSKYMVCESHFEANDYYTSKNTRILKKNSVPKLHCKYRSVIKYVLVLGNRIIRVLLSLLAYNFVEKTVL